MSQSINDKFYEYLKKTLEASIRFRGMDPVFEALTFQESIVVEIIGSREPVSMSELAKAYGTLPNTMTGIVDRLVKRSIVERKPSAKDRRSILVKLTEYGFSLHKHHKQRLRKYTSQLLKVLTLEERKTLVDLFERIIRTLSE